MKRRYITGLLALTALTLTGCMTRDQADQKLARGCAAAIELFQEENAKILEIRSKRFADDKLLGRGYREVILVLLEGDEWYDSEKEYKCVFAETLAPFGLSYAASIYQLQMDDKVYGKQGDQIMGTMQDHLKLTETVDKALNGF